MTLTDGREGLQALQAENVAANAGLLAHARVDLQQLEWGAAEPPAGPWDLVLGSDVTYDDDDATVLALVSTLDALLHPAASPAPRVVLAHDHRHVAEQSK